MSLFTYHLAQTSPDVALKALLFPAAFQKVQGLIHAECTTVMTLGAPVFSASRVRLRQISFFAQWEDEAAIDRFLETNSFGKVLSQGWHARLLFTRQWGSIRAFDIPTESKVSADLPGPVVAVTIARMKPLQIPRFIRWGRPVECLVRDHPGTTLSLASIRFPNTVSTFSIWKSLQEMTSMVQGHSAVPRPHRHLHAMEERERKDFHFEFTTLRFKPVSEYGTWQGKQNFIPRL